MSGRSRGPGQVTPSVSVIIPTWNRSNTIGAAIESVVSQTQPVLEILVCDDGSDDGTSEIVADIARQDARVRWLPGRRAGCPAIPRNRGIQESRGEWLAFLDSDDAWEQNKIAIELQTADASGSFAVCSNAVRILSDGSEAGLLLDWNRPQLTLSNLLKVNNVICSSCMVERSVLDRTGGFPEEESFRAIEDYALWLRVAAITNFAFCPDSLVLYKDDPESSVRADQDLTPTMQKALVLENLYSWLHAHGELSLKGRSILVKVWAARYWNAIKSALA